MLACTTGWPCCGPAPTASPRSSTPPTRRAGRALPRLDAPRPGRPPRRRAPVGRARRGRRYAGPRARARRSAGAPRWPSGTPATPRTSSTCWPPARPTRPPGPWTPNRTAGFWRRRQVHETALHLWDAERAAGTPTPFDPALSWDGVLEVPEVMYPRQVRLGRIEPLARPLGWSPPTGRGRPPSGRRAGRGAGERRGAAAAALAPRRPRGRGRRPARGRLLASPLTP